MTYQWRVFQANLDPASGHEQAGHRPVLVVSAEPLAERYAVVMVAPITSRKGGRPARLGEVMLAAGTAGLRQDSFALCYQVRALDRSRLGRDYGAITDPEVKERVLATLADCFDID